MEISVLGDRLDESIISKHEEYHKCQERQANTAEKTQNLELDCPCGNSRSFIYYVILKTT